MQQIMCDPIICRRQDSVSGQWSLVFADAEGAEPLPDRGELWSWTMQRFPPKSPPYAIGADQFEPFLIGYVKVPGMIIESRLICPDEDRLRIGMRMELDSLIYDAEGARRIFAYRAIFEGAANA